MVFVGGRSRFLWKGSRRSTFVIWSLCDFKVEAIWVRFPVRWMALFCTAIVQGIDPRLLSTKQTPKRSDLFRMLRILMPCGVVRRIQRWRCDICGVVSDQSSNGDRLVKRVHNTAHTFMKRRCIVHTLKLLLCVLLFLYKKVSGIVGSSDSFL